MKTGIGTDISYALKLLRQGEVIAIPTETVYGLATDATKASCLEKIFKLKERDYNKPLVVQLSQVTALERLVVEIPGLYKNLMEKFWPGPITLIFKKSQLLPGLLTGKKDTIGIRIPDHEMTLSLLEQLDFPLAVTSANISGEKETISADGVYELFKGKIPYILDGGKCRISKQSTVLGIQNNQLLILRHGAISEKEIRSAVNPAPED